MASTRELVESHAYLRRRLVSAFVDGAREDGVRGDARRSPPVVASLVLGCLLLGGAMVWGLVWGLLAAHL